jgi:hypothetical protein
MPCIHFGGGIVTYQHAYSYKGFVFEWHSYLGPTRLVKKTGEVSKKQGDRFYDTVMEWNKLSKEEKEKTML